MKLIKKILLLILIIIVIGVLGYIGYVKYEQHRTFTWRKNAYESKIENIEFQLSNLTTDYVIEIKDVQGFEMSDKYFLKVEDISNDTLNLSVFNIEKSFPTNCELEKTYLKVKNNAKKIKVKKELLFNCITKDYRKFKNRDRKGISFFDDKRKFGIINIYRIYDQEIKIDGLSVYLNFVNFRIINNGCPVDLISIENIEGHLKWLNELPARIESSMYRDNISFSLNAKNFIKDENYKFIFTIQDSLGTNHKYQIVGVNNDYNLNIIK